MKNIKMYLLIAFTMTGLVSCEKYLSIEPKGVIIPQYLNDYEGILNSNVVANPFGYGSINLTPTDDVKDYSYSLDDLDDQSANAYFWKPYLNTLEQRSPAVWSEMYNCIANLNVITEGVMDAHGGTQKQKKQLFAEAMVSKAYCYFVLLSYFSPAYDPATAATKYGVPYVISIDQGKETPERPSLEKSFTTITKDVLDAIPDLPQTNNSKVRTNKYTAYALLSRIYLYMHDVENALKYSNLALSSPAASIVDYNEYLIEGTPPESNISPEELWTKYSDGVYYLFSDDLLSKFDQDNDLRFYFFATDEDAEWSYDDYYYAVNWGISWPEIYLNKAECLARKGEISESLKIINEGIRKKRFDNAGYTALTASTKEECIDAVLGERRRELMFKGLRWSDMKRLDQEGRMKPVIRKTNAGNILATLSPHSKQYTFEIPLVVQKFNPKMPLNQ